MTKKQKTSNLHDAGPSVDYIESIFKDIEACKKQPICETVVRKKTKNRKRPIDGSFRSEEIKGKEKKVLGGEIYGQLKSEYSKVIISPEAPIERIDLESGLPVYKAHLLRVGEGGGTNLCPFDCDCCF